MKSQILFSLKKDKSKKLKCRLLQFCFGVLWVKQFSQIQKALNMSIVKTFRIVDTTSIILGPELQYFLQLRST